MRKKSAFSIRIDIQIITILLFLAVFLALLVGRINDISLYNAYKKNLTDWALFVNMLVAGTIDAEEIKYFADLMLAQGEDFRRQQIQFYHDREEFYRLQNSGASIEKRQAAMAKMNAFLDAAREFKTDRYWRLVGKFAELKAMSHTKFLYALMDIGLHDTDGTVLCPYIVDADDMSEMDVSTGYDIDGFGTVAPLDEAVRQVYVQKKPMDAVGEYEGGYGKLYYAHAPIMDNGGNIIAVLGTDIGIDETYAEIAQYIRISNWLFFTCFMVFILAVYLFLRFFVTTPVRQLTAAIQEIAEGKMLTPVPAAALKSRNEISILARAISDLRGVFQRVIRGADEFTGALHFGLPEAHASGLPSDSMTDRIESFLNETEQLLQILQNILNGIDAMVYVSVPDTGAIIFMNQAMKTHYNLKGDFVGHLCYKVLQAGVDTRCPFCPCHELDADPKKVIVWEEHSTLTKRIYRNTDRYIKWPGGGLVHLQHSVDITELIGAKEEAIQANAAKGKFLASISQEIRTPMNAVHGIAEKHMQGGLAPEVAEAFSRIYQSSSMVLRIINDLQAAGQDSGSMEPGEPASP